MATRTRAKKTTAPAPEVEEVTEDAFEELEEIEDAAEEIEEVAPARKGKASTTAKSGKTPPADTGPTFNTQWLASYITEQTGEPTDARSLRMLLRKMANSGELDREVGTERERYSFPKGAADPTVKAVLKKVKAGELKAAKTEGLDKVKATAAKKRADQTAKSAEVEEVEELPEELEAPKPTRTRKAAPKAGAAPAKAQPSTRRRRTA